LNLDLSKDLVDNKIVKTHPIDQNDNINSIKGIFVSDDNMIQTSFIECDYVQKSLITYQF
jgi:hypothetical protein